MVYLAVKICCCRCAAYMEIGTANVSAVIGPYSHPVAMTTDKFSVPYLVTWTWEARQQRRQMNVINVLPLNIDLVSVTADFISLAHWTSVAVVSQPNRGIHSTLSLLSRAYLLTSFDASNLHNKRRCLFICCLTVLTASMTIIISSGAATVGVVDVRTPQNSSWGCPTPPK